MQEIGDTSGTNVPATYFRSDGDDAHLATLPSMVIVIEKLFPSTTGVDSEDLTPLYTVIVYGVAGANAVTRGVPAI